MMYLPSSLTIRYAIMAVRGTIVISVIRNSCAWQKNVGPAGPFNPTAWNESCVNVCVKTKRDCREFNVCICNSVFTYLAVMCIFVSYKCFSWDSNQQWDLGRPSQEKISKPSYWWEAHYKKAIDGKLLSILSHVVSEKNQSALRREQRWIHSLRCCQCQATQVCIKQSVIW